MKRLLVAALALACAPAVAQKLPSALSTDIDAAIKPGVPGGITATTLNTLLKSMNGSYGGLIAPNTWTAQQSFDFAPIFTPLTGYLYCNGAAQCTSSLVIPNTDITGLSDLSTTVPGTGVATALTIDANATGGIATYPVAIATGVSGLGTGVATALAAAPNATAGVVTFGGNIGAATGTSLNLSSSAFVADNAGNLTLTRGLLAAGSAGVFSGTFSDGLVMDYATGNARISTGPADSITFYNGGVANSQLAQISATGSLALAAGIVGKTNATDAAAGQVGEVLSATATNVAITNAGTTYDVTSKALTAGDWDVQATAYVANNGGALTAAAVSLSLTSATHDSTPAATGLPYSVAYGITTEYSGIVYRRVNVSAASTTVYLTASIAGSGAAKASGAIVARRVR